MSVRADGLCVRGSGTCPNPAVICEECLRSAVVCDGRFGFASIARRPELAADCRLCALGPAALCPSCFFFDGYRRRELVLQDKNPRVATVVQLRSPLWAGWAEQWAGRIR